MKKNDILLAVLGGVTALCLVTAIILVVITGLPKQGEFTPPPFDDTAVVGVPPLDEAAQKALGWQYLQPDGAIFRAAACGAVKVNEGRATVYFTNPDTNTVNLKLRILDANGNILGESGLIRPGEYVESIALSTVPEVGAAISMKIMSYQSESYQSEGSFQMNTVISP